MVSNPIYGLISKPLNMRSGWFLRVLGSRRSEERRVGKECRLRWSPYQAEDGIRDADVTGVQTCALPISLKSSIQLHDFNAAALIKRTPCEAWSQLYPELIQHGIQPDIRADIQTIEYALGLVSAGVGIALVPNFDVLYERQDVVLRPLADIKLQRTIGLAYPHAKVGCSPALDWLREVCRQRASVRVTS